MEALYGRWLERVVDEEIVIDAQDIMREAHGNLDQFAPRAHELQWISVGGVMELLERLIQRRHEQLHGAAMTWYCWHDAQAGQLRTSMVSTSHQRLPFACNVLRVATPEVVARSVVEQDWLASETLTVSTTSDILADDAAAFELAVFAVDLRPASPP